MEEKEEKSEMLRKDRRRAAHDVTGISWDSRSLLQRCCVPAVRRVVSCDVAAAIAPGRGTPAQVRQAAVSLDARLSSRQGVGDTHESSSFLLSLGWSLTFRLLLVTSPGYFLSSRQSCIRSPSSGSDDTNDWPAGST